jgi:hypothetical protein
MISRAALLALLAAIAGQRCPQLYPTDACVASKLNAAALYCAQSIANAADPNDPAIAAARQDLADAWAAAESTSAARGVSCMDTTANADEMVAAIDSAAASAVSEVATASVGGADCTSRRQALLASACQNLLQQEARHIQTRSIDRTRSQLAAARARIAPRIDSQLADQDAPECQGGPGGAALVSIADTVAGAARFDAYVSPRVSSDWTMITPDAEVPYDGKTLDPICARGTPWVFFVKRGTVNKTVMYYQGGGACWDYTTCTFPTYKVTTGPSDNPANATHGFADMNNPANPFKDWNEVFVPYCTGDLAWGDTVQTYSAGKNSVTIRHKGFVNAQVAEKWAREHFANPDEVFVTGSSAGGYSAIIDSLPLQEFVWPSSDFAVLGDAANGVITDDFKANDLTHWGVEKNLPKWIPGYDVPITQLDASKLWSIAAEFYPHHRYANYASAFDGGQGGQTGFYNVMLNIDNPLTWLNWWPPSCEWDSIMRSQVHAAAATAPNYRYYIGSGSRHTMWGSDKVYTDTTGNVPLLVDWVTAMVNGTSDWVNVESDDPGLLLPGDPRPNPPEPPYTADGRVVCE